MRYLLFLLFPSLLFGSTYSTENVDADGYYGCVTLGVNKRTTNFGGCTRISTKYDTDVPNGNTYSIGVWAWNSITTQGGGYAVACTMFVEATTVTASGNISAYFQMKPYFEGSSCNSTENGSSSWDEWYQHTTGTLDTLFTTKGNVAPTSWGDGGSTWNRSDATGNDRTSSASATVNVTSTGSKSFVLDTTFVNKFLRGTIPQLIILGIPANATELEWGDMDDPDWSGAYTVLHIWWADAASAPSRGTGRFGKSTTGAYLNDR